ncbi:hypothetical protein L917_00620, partial [Phytophthora nicotianae]
MCGHGVHYWARLSARQETPERTHFTSAVDRQSVSNAVANLSVAVVQRGIANYDALERSPTKPAWSDLTNNVTDSELAMDAPLDELEVTTSNEHYQVYDPAVFLPASLEEVETVKILRFKPDVEMAAPDDLYERNEKNTKTQLSPPVCTLSLVQFLC